jgi:hypothetical protein
VIDANSLADAREHVVFLAYDRRDDGVIDRPIICSAV